MSKIIKVITPDNLSNTSFDKGVNTPNKIEIKLQYTIANLKSRTDLPNVVFITDNGKEGLFEYDSADTTSTGDDTLIIVTNSGKRYKKRTESLVNKSTDVNLGTSDTLYPTQKAVKNYVDTLLTVITNNILFIWKLFSGFTIAELRLLTNSQLALVTYFSCNEQGRIKDWYYDSTDTTSTDNDGTILVTIGEKRLKATNYDYLRPENFGAIGDGISNDTNSLKSCIYTADIEKKPIKIKNTYLFKETLIFPRGINISGINNDTSILRLDNSCNVDGIWMYNSDSAIVENFRLEGNRKRRDDVGDIFNPSGNTSGNGIVIKGGEIDYAEGRNRKSIIRNVHIIDFAENGIRAYFGSWLWKVINSKSDRNGQYGIYTTGSDSDFIDVQCWDNYQGGIRDAGGNNHFTNAKLFFNGIDNNDSAGFWSDASYRSSMVNIECQDNYYHGFKFTSSRYSNTANLLADGNGAAYRSVDGTGNRGHLEIHDTTTVSYGFKLDTTQYLNLNGNSTNYRTPAGQRCSIYINNSSNCKVRIFSQPHEINDIRINSTEIEEIDNSYNSFSFNSNIINRAVIVGTDNSDNYYRTIAKIISPISTDNHRLSLDGYIYIGNSFGNSTISKYQFQILYQGQDSVNSESFQLFLENIPVNLFRIVKKDTNSYELQIRPQGTKFTAIEMYLTGSTGVAKNDLTMFNFLSDVSDVAFLDSTNCSVLTQKSVDSLSIVNKKSSTEVNYTKTLIDLNLLDEYDYNRGYEIRQNGVGANTVLEIRAKTDGKTIKFASTNGSSVIEMLLRDTNNSTLYLARAGGKIILNSSSDNGEVLQVNGNLSLKTAGNKIKITEGTNGSIGQTTLVSGTKSITISGLTTSSRAKIQLVSIGGTVTTTWQYSAVCTTNTLTITALTNSGTTNTLDTSVLNYIIYN